MERERAGDEEYGAEEDEFSFYVLSLGATKRKSPWKVPPNKVLSIRGLPLSPAVNMSVLLFFYIFVLNSKHQNEWHKKKFDLCPQKEKKEKSTTEWLLSSWSGKSRRVNVEGGRYHASKKKAAHAWCEGVKSEPSERGSLSLSKLAGPVLLQLSSCLQISIQQLLLKQSRHCS